MLFGSAVWRCVVRSDLAAVLAFALRPLPPKQLLKSAGVSGSSVASPLSLLPPALAAFASVCAADVLVANATSGSGSGAAGASAGASSSAAAAEEGEQRGPFSEAEVG
jgi:hypothetical protein